MKNLYLDSSAVLRYLYRQPGFLDLRGRPEHAVASPLTETECLRTLDRNRLVAADDAVESRQGTLAELMRHIEFVDLTPAILRRVGTPLAAPLGTLDAIHLVTALTWCEINGAYMTIATHDRALARAARLYGLQVIGAAG